MGKQPQSDTSVCVCVCLHVFKPTHLAHNTIECVSLFSIFCFRFSFCLSSILLLLCRRFAQQSLVVRWTWTTGLWRVPSIHALPFKVENISVTTNAFIWLTAFWHIILTSRLLLYFPSARSLCSVSVVVCYFLCARHFHAAPMSMAILCNKTDILFYFFRSSKWYLHQQQQQQQRLPNDKAKVLVSLIALAVAWCWCDDDQEESRRMQCIFLYDQIRPHSDIVRI